MRITPRLIAWQFENYPTAHADRRNLLIHAFTNPLFWSGSLAFLVGLLTLTPRLLVAGPICWAIAMVLQGRGHKIEKNPPAPFASALDVVARIFVEQHYTFPRFVFTGGFEKAWNSALKN